MNDAFVQYLNNDDVHDGVIRRVSEEPDRLRVFVDTADGRVVVFEFNSVRHVKQNRPEGMLLYSLTELRESGGLRRFIFTNWEEDDEAFLEVTAMGVASRETTER
ncbi:MAG TPA: hypothetical protein VGK82_02000 [Pyrinomonadaceae bacterium]